jgi:hypothetical protein
MSMLGKFSHLKIQNNLVQKILIQYKGKAVPVQARAGPEGSRLRLPHFKISSSSICHGVGPLVDFKIFDT